MSQEVTTPAPVVPWRAPTSVVVLAGEEGGSVGIESLPIETLDAQVARWLDNVYANANRASPWVLK